MTYRLVVQPLAKADIFAAKEWYVSQQPGLELQFRDQLDAAFRRIESNPLAFAIVYRNVRQAILNRFPYVVSFVVTGETVRVIAVLHGRRRPETWRDRDA